jgi:hypothetical protein
MAREICSPTRSTWPATGGDCDRRYGAAGRCFLLRGVKGGRNAVLSLVTQGIVALDLQLAPELEAVRKLMAKYARVPMALADAHDRADVARRRGDGSIARERRPCLPNRWN